MNPEKVTGLSLLINRVKSSPALMRLFMSCMSKAQEDGGFSTIFKWAAVLVAIWVISPVDPIPDWFLVVGWIDDLAVLVGLYYAIPEDFFTQFQQTLQQKAEASESPVEAPVGEDEVLEAEFEENS